EENKNGLAKFNFKDITTFKVTVMNADVEAESEAKSDTENGERGELNPANNENNIKNVKAKNIDVVTERVTEKGAERVTEKQQLILDNIAKNPYITSNELAVRIGISAVKVRVNLSKLKDKGLVERIGGDRGGYWKIN
ncbi:hypothetical protein EZS27_042107, partial [termite gut metagenome]